MRQGLLIIDVQNDYFKGGKMTLAQPEKALHQINRLEEHFLANHLPIIYIQHLKNNSNADFFGIGTTGSLLQPALNNQPTSVIIEKHYPNSFYQTNLQQTLTELGVTQLVITGMMTHMCVDSTTRASQELGYQPILIADTTATKNLIYDGLEVSAANVQSAFLSALQPFAQVMTTQHFLSQ